jgi:hypothetical protein
MVGMTLSTPRVTPSANLALFRVDVDEVVDEHGLDEGEEVDHSR